MFRFRLHTVLDLRRAERDERRSELAKALRAAEVLADRRRQLADEMNDNQQLARKISAPGSGNVDRMVHVHRYEAILKGTLTQLLIQEKQIAAEVERRTLVLIEADRQVRVLEKLEERQRGEYLRGQERLEMKQLDEAAAHGYLRQQNELAREGSP